MTLADRDIRDLRRCLTCKHSNDCRNREVPDGDCYEPRPGVQYTSPRFSSSTEWNKWKHSQDDYALFFEPRREWVSPLSVPFWCCLLRYADYCANRYGGADFWIWAFGLRLELVLRKGKPAPCFEAIRLAAKAAHERYRSLGKNTKYGKLLDYISEEEQAEREEGIAQASSQKRQQRTDWKRWGKDIKYFRYVRRLDAGLLKWELWAWILDPAGGELATGFPKGIRPRVSFYFTTRRNGFWVSVARFPYLKIPPNVEYMITPRYMLTREELYPYAEAEQAYAWTVFIEGHRCLWP